MTLTTTEILIIIFGILALLCLQFPLARAWAAARNKRTVSLFGGLVTYVVWRKNELVIFEREGSPIRSFIERDLAAKDGGARFITILSGDRIACRVSFVKRPWEWEGTVATQEGINCQLKIVATLSVDRDAQSVEKFVYENKSELHLDEAGEIDVGSLGREWLTQTIEEAGAEVSKESLGEMIVLEVPKYGSSEDARLESSTHSRVWELSPKLRKLLCDKLDNEAKEHGMRVSQVQVAPLKFPEEVIRKVRETFLTIYEPLQAGQKAEAYRIMEYMRTDTKLNDLKGHVDVMGKPYVQGFELFKAAQPMLKNDQLYDILVSVLKTIEPSDNIPLQPGAPASPLPPKKDDDESKD
jgi:hypothetical protein